MSKFKTYCAGCGRELDAARAVPFKLSYHDWCAPDPIENLVEDCKAKHMNEENITEELRTLGSKLDRARQPRLQLVK